MNVHRFYEPLLRHFRKKRMERFARLFGITENKTVLDLGGLPFNWELLPVRPRLTLLNLPNSNIAADWCEVRKGDGCETPFASASFDVVFSNSVIEHVGDWQRQKQFARECARCGHGYYVQTPNRWFPVDPHTFLPFLHWLPRRWWRKIVRFSPRVLLFHTAPAELADLAGLRLLGRREMAELFPGAEIIEERFLGITKSLIAVAGASPLLY